MPKIKGLIFHNLQIDYNLNTFHRLIFMKDVRIFFEMIGIESGKFFSFLNKISNSIGSYFIKVTEDDLNKLIKEYLRYIYILVNYKVERSSMMQILEDVYYIVEMVSSN